MIVILIVVCGSFPARPGAGRRAAGRHRLWLAGGMMAALKLLHTADVHLGAAFGFLGRRGREHRAQLKSTFSRVVDLALTSQVDVLLIAGDLFDSPYPQPGTVGEVLYQLGRLDAEGIWTVIVPGTHDRLLPGGVYDGREFSGLAHLHLFREEEMTPLVLEKLDLTVYGRATTREERDVLEGFRADGETRWRVGLLHASFLMPGKVERDEMLVSGDGIAQSGLHYLALGHWHSMAEYSQGGVAAFYPGPPEPLDMARGEEGKVILVELDESSLQVKPITVGRRRLLRTGLDASELGGPAELYSALRRMADRDLALDARVYGFWGEEWAECDWDKLEEELSPLFFHLHVEASQGGLGDRYVQAYPEQTVIGRFIRLAGEEMAGMKGEEALVAEEALRLGLAHLTGRFDSR
jgi:DNA repair exonuclease SbcCD nuclease subunit